jgi:glycosyltransferase involved in cell wall biosynthesis
MNSSALVEIVIPTYNQADFLRVALRSVIAQDHQNWVATVVNNLSSDHTHNVVRDLADSRIRIVDFANHGVIAASRNLAIQDSRADFIAFLDSDDWWQPTKLSACLSRLDDGTDLVCHAEEWCNDYSSRVVRYGPQHRMEYEAMLLGGNCLSTSAIVGRTRVFQQLGGFSERPDFVTAEDYDLWLRVAKSGHRIALIDDVLGTFRIHSASASSSIARNSAAEMTVVHEHLKTSSLGARARRRRLGLSHYSAARAYQKSGDRASARRELARAWRNAPLIPRIYAGILTLTLDSLRRPSRSGAAR